MTTLQEQRRAARHKDANGFLVSDLCPDDKHGTSSGYVIFMCHCPTCRKWASTARSETIKRKAINDDVLNAHWRDQLREQIRNEVIDELNLCAKCAGKQDAPTSARTPGEWPEPQKSHFEAKRQEAVPEPAPEPKKPITRKPLQLPRVKSPIPPAVFEAPAPVETKPTNGHSNGTSADDLLAQLRNGTKIRESGKVPPVIPAVREMIKTVATLDSIGKAYFEPDWVAPLDNGRERRAAGAMEVIVDPKPKPVIIAFHEREVAEGKPELVVEKTGGIAKAKGGGGGSQGPKTWDQLKGALDAMGATFEKTGTGHIKVSKNGKSIILPSTSSDWRAIRNSLADARRRGLL